MKIQQRLYSWLQKISVGHWTARQLALSFCVGAYIAFSPFPGFHTWMTLVVAWTCSLNVAVIFAASCGINNPWTMIPIYGSDYLLGDWILCHIFGTSDSVCALDPAWMSTVNAFLKNYIGIERISLWGFLLGGNILGIAAAFALYPLAKKVFEAIKKEDVSS